MSTTLNAQSEREIYWFDDLGTGNEEFRFLSNFYADDDPLRLAGMEFQTGEHLFQAMKARNMDDFEKVRNAKGPQGAKSTGRTIALRSDWEQVKYDVMVATLRMKFVSWRREGSWLMNTGSAYLCEGTFWGDTVWGVDLKKSKSTGRNWLGSLLMARRAELVALGEDAPSAYYNLKFAGWKLLPITDVRDSGSGQVMKMKKQLTYAPEGV